MGGRSQPGGPSPKAALPSEERNPSPNNGLETYRERQKKSELESSPSLGPPRPALHSLLPPSQGPRLSPPASLSPSLAPPPPRTLSPSPGTPFLSLFLFSLLLSPHPSFSFRLPLTPSWPHCLYLLLSLSLLVSLRSPQYILTLLYAPSPHPAEVCSQREGSGLGFLILWAPTHCPKTGIF